jgi:putative flippase GtrA
MSAGGAVNLATYALLVAFVAPVAALPALGVAAGSIAGLMVNFGLAHTFVFKAARRDGAAEAGVALAAPTAPLSQQQRPDG